MQQKPNFILIFPDQWRGDCLGSLNHPVVETPFLDHIAEEGITFTSAYSAAPTCIPARACLATGQTPSTHGRLGYQDGVPWNYENTLMKCLRDGGYQTLQAGKTHFYPQRAALGFEEMRLYEIPIRDAGFESDYHVWLSRETNNKIQDIARQADPNTWVVKPWTHDEYLHPTNWTIDAAIELLWRRDITRPFFMQIGIHRPHAPYDPPIHYYEMYKDKELPAVPMGDWASEYDQPAKKVNCWRGRLPQDVLDRTRRAYFANITHIDYQIGRLYNWLQKNGLLESTYIIFTSDHGELLGDHCTLRKSTPMEGSAKIPFIIRPPKNICCKRGTKNEAPITHMDIMPTILTEAGLPIPGSVEGCNFAPLLYGAELPWREYIHGEHANHDTGWQYVTDGKKKYIWESQTGQELFFDLESDPNEEKNLSELPEYADMVSIWRQRLISILASRPDDGLSDGIKLIPGRILPAVRKELFQNK